MGGKGIAICLILVEIIFPFVLLDEREADFLLLQFGKQGLEIGFVKMLQSGSNFLNAKTFLQAMDETVALLMKLLI